MENNVKTIQLYSVISSRGTHYLLMVSLSQWETGLPIEDVFLWNED